MPRYRRFYFGSTWFFTVVTHQRRPFLCTDSARRCLREAVVECRGRYPFSVEGWVLMPQHLHCVWSLPEEDTDYSRRWGVIKRLFTQRFREAGGGRPPYWQRRFWAHWLIDERDLRNHLHYLHFNPVKHGVVERVVDWPWSSFHWWVARGEYGEDWGGEVRLPEGVGRE
ncbi:REP-associated tyrosine transposase [Endothiovibrio diazotrophicus]